MDITFNNLETTETTRRNLLKYGVLSGISALAGIKILQTGLQLPTILSEPAISSNIVDYTTKPYNVFLVSENINQVNRLLTKTRVENVYVYSHTLNAHISNKVISNNNLQKLLLSLGSIIPFDYDITCLDMKAWKVRDAFLYISEAYANIQNNNTVLLNEEKLLSSLNTIGLYNKGIYVSSTSAWNNNNVIIKNDMLPIGNIITL